MGLFRVVDVVLELVFVEFAVDEGDFAADLLPDRRTECFHLLLLFSNNSG